MLAVTLVRYSTDPGAPRFSHASRTHAQGFLCKDAPVSLPCVIAVGLQQATSMALTAFPTLNASLSDDKKCLLQHPSHNIGVAMDTAKGLLVPCISAVEEMSVLDIAEVRFVDIAAAAAAATAAAAAAVFARVAAAFCLQMLLSPALLPPAWDACWF